MPRDLPQEKRTVPVQSAERDSEVSPDNEEPSFEEEVSKDEVAKKPSELGDPAVVVEAKIPADIRDRYEIYSYRNAAVILSETRTEQFNELLAVLRAFHITRTMIRSAGGNESDIPKLLNKELRPQGWHETIIQGDLLVKLYWREQVGVIEKGKGKGKPLFEKRSREIRRKKFLDGHKIDYVKERVAFDLEWNSKDQSGYNGRPLG